MGHSVYLSENQIISLIENNEVIADGACVPVVKESDGTTTEPAAEMITKYSLLKGEKNSISGSNRGFTIKINRPKDLLPLPEGCKWVGFNVSSVFENNKIIHQVVIMPETTLIESTI